MRREFFFDVHPPLSVPVPHLGADTRPFSLTVSLSSCRSRSAKLLLAFAGWVIGYDGHFEFENIGESYIDNKVPYIGLRTLPALMGSLVPSVMYAIMRESGYPRLVGLLSASLVLFGASLLFGSRHRVVVCPVAYRRLSSLASRQRAHHADAAHLARRASRAFHVSRVLRLHPILQTALFVSHAPDIYLSGSAVT